MANKDFYDAYWQNDLHLTPEWDLTRIRRIFGPLLGKTRVLDYGCGLGTAYQRLLSQQVDTYAAADISRVALDKARESGYSAFPVDPQTGEIEAESEYFDGATCVEVFEHLFDPLQAARELHRVLKPKRVLVATVPNFGYLPWRLLALLRAQVPAEPERPDENRFNGVHIRFFSKLTFARLLRDAGFADVRIGSFDDSSIWDITRSTGHLGRISYLARQHLPAPFHLRFLQDLWPNVFAIRLRAVAIK